MNNPLYEKAALLAVAKRGAYNAQVYLCDDTVLVFRMVPGTFLGKSLFRRFFPDYDRWELAIKNAAVCMYEDKKSVTELESTEEVLQKYFERNLLAMIAYLDMFERGHLT